MESVAHGVISPEIRQKVELLAKTRGWTLLLMDRLWRQVVPTDPDCYVVICEQRPTADCPIQRTVIWDWNADGNFFTHGDYFDRPLSDDGDMRMAWEDQQEAFKRFFERRRRG